MDNNYGKHELQEKKRLSEIERVFEEALELARKKAQPRTEA